ncbi:MAG: efflux RND transporter periplasmic adaptor subunit [Acidobacteria bacterium]|nr:MAG: efflux RND transporter periplasmic adaptor subunit [Acidobacteriota bacterium]
MMRARRTNETAWSRIAAAAALAMWLLPAAGCAGGEGRREAAVEEQPLAVEVAEARREAVPQLTEASGGVEPWRRAAPGTKILGRVETVAVSEGQHVAAGALLAKLDTRDLEAAVEQAEAAVAMAEAQLENARTQHRRMVDLHERGSVTDKNVEDAVAALRVREAALEQAKANLAAARVTLGYAEIRAPFAGWVVDKRVERGDMAAPGAPLFVIEDLSRVKVRVQVPEASVIGLGKGGPARVRIDALDLDREATIARVIPAGDPASRTFDVEVVLDNPDGAIRSGMFARVSFPRGEREVLVVPERALVRRGQLVGLYVVGKDGRARLRWIRTGAKTERGVEVLSGLDAGERYVVEPPPELTDGRAVVER